jgi:hypothetical protein
MAKFYLAALQAVLLYGAADTWVVSQLAIKWLRSFHHRCAWYITRQNIWKDDDDKWICPASAELLEQAGLKTKDKYTSQKGRIRSSAMPPRGHLSRM